MPVKERTASPPELLVVEVGDPTGQQQVLLEGVRPSATAEEVVGMALSAMQLPPNIDWDLRDDATTRLLPQKEAIGAFARDTAPHIRVTMQPDAGLGERRIRAAEARSPTGLAAVSAPEGLPMTPTTPRFHLEIQRPADGARFPGPPVPDSFFQEPRDQAVFLGQRRGVVGPDAAEARTGVEPISAGDDGQVAGVKVTAERDGRQVETVFGIDLFAPLARLEIARLAKQGRLGEEDKVVYRVFTEAAAAVGARSETVPQPGGGVTARVMRKPLPLRPGRLADWRAASTPVGEINDADYPLFVTESALRLARDYCRKPVDREGGALLLGGLFRQGDPGPEIFGVIRDVIEAKYAEQKLFSLNLNTDGFAYLNGQLRLRRERLGRADEVPLGFAHAHNFLPSVLDDGKANCPSCPLRPTCQLTSSFYSAADVEFHRALFSRAPYAVGFVWGYTPREEDDLRAFQLDGGQARERGYYRIPDHAIPPHPYPSPAGGEG